jgi:hypothetical protein
MHIPWYSFRFCQHNSGLQSQCALCMEWHLQTLEIWVFITHSPGSKQILLFMKWWLLHLVTSTCHSLLKGSLLPLCVWSRSIRWLLLSQWFTTLTISKGPSHSYELLLPLDNECVVLVCNQVVLNKLIILHNSTERPFCAVYVLMSL